MKEFPQLKVTAIAKIIAERYHRLPVDEIARLDEIGKCNEWTDGWMDGWMK